MKVQSYVDHRIAGATLQQSEATMPSHWAKAHRGRAVRPWVGRPISLHPYKPLGL